jgi:hypothetical protein
MVILRILLLFKKCWKKQEIKISISLKCLPLFFLYSCLPPSFKWDFRLSFSLPSLSVIRQQTVLSNIYANREITSFLTRSSVSHIVSIWSAKERKYCKTALMPFYMVVSLAVYITEKLLREGVENMP